MNPEAFFSKTPQSVLLVGTRLETLQPWVETWASRLLRITSEAVYKHPDFHAVFPTNKMRQISVDRLREFTRNVYHSSNQGGRKVFVIYEADRLNVAAANALLKTLEEPTEDSSIFLVTVRPYDLLPTLRSRCWWISFPEVEEERGAEGLQEWLEDFTVQVTRYITQKVPFQPMKMYGLLYRLQAYVSRSTEMLSVDSQELLSEEEILAKKAGLEKRRLQQVFQSIEQELSSVARKIHSQEVWEYYPQWIARLERCYQRTEVNFGAIPALEAFFLPFCHPLS